MDSRVVQRQALKDGIAAVELENQELLANLKTMQEAVASLAAAAKTEDLTLRD